MRHLTTSAHTAETISSGHQAEATAVEAADARAAAPACFVVGQSRVKLWGLSGEARLQRSLGRVGARDVTLSPDGKVTVDDPDAPVLLLRADHVFEEPLLAALLETPGVALFADEAETPAALFVLGEDAEAMGRALAEGTLPEGHGLRRAGPAEVGGTYNKKLRKRAVPYLLLATEENRAEVEKRMFAGSYKGVTDVVSKYAWPVPARHVTRLCAVVGLTPNMVTSVGLGLTLLTFWLFWNGHFGLGLATGWLMTFLDTVDGKLARVTLTSSKFGDLFDHLIDLIHPPFWWWAWLHAVGADVAHPEIVLSVIVSGYILQRFTEGAFMGLFGIEMHVWRRFDSVFRLFTARRNPNMLILTAAALASAPAIGIELLALWTAVCLAVHVLQVVEASVRRASGLPIHSWMSR